MIDPVVAYVEDVEKRAKTPAGVLTYWEIILFSELQNFPSMQEKCAFMRGIWSMKNLVREEIRQKHIIIVEMSK